MGRPAAILVTLGLLVVAGFFAWAFYFTRGEWTGGSRAIVIAMAAGAIGVGALTGALMWLAFYSARKGYDESPQLEANDPDTEDTQPPDDEGAK
jgi:high-affinity Fe2+/Pb2+ permease